MRKEFQRKSIVPGVVTHTEKIAAPGRSSIAHQNIQPTERALQRGYQAARLGRRSEIGDMNKGFATDCLDFSRDRPEHNRREVYASIAQSGVRHVGCKDVGLPTEELKALMDDIRSNGHETWIEVVSETEEDTLASARAAAEIRPDHLIGGTLIEPVQEILAGTGVKFWPYVGQIVGHPCLLRGSFDEIVADTKRAAELGVDGINLLAYRYDGDVEALTRAVVGASDLPVICAGSVDSVERIRALEACGAWAFTIGTAALDGVLVENTPLSGQLEAALGAAGAPA